MIIAISGGTDGIGRELALTRLRLGDTVIAIGSNAAKGAALLAETTGAAHFLQADLSSIAENQRVVTEITRDHPHVDALVLCANRPMPRRQVTPDGLEFTFALYYLSRYLLGHGLRAQFSAAPNPTIINVAAPGITQGHLHFDDLQLERRYSTIRAQAQAGRANDLLGVAFAQERSSKARYHLYHPGFTATPNMGTHFGWPTRTILRLLARIAAKPVPQAVAPLLPMIDSPPPAALTASDRGTAVDLTGPTFNPTTARRLSAITHTLVQAKAGDIPLLPPAPTQTT